MDSTPHKPPDMPISPLGWLMRVIYGFNACIPFLLIVAGIVLGGLGRVIGLYGFFDFVGKNLRPHIFSIGLGATSLALLVLLIKRRRVKLPILLVTVSGILFQPVELANVAAVSGMPVSLFLWAEEYLSRAGRWNWFTQVLAFVGSFVVGAFLGVMVLMLRQRFMA